MDKSWTLESRVSIAYEEGVKRFLDFSFANAISRDMIKCPFKNCNSVYYRSRDEVYEHLICDGFEKNYARGVWIFHGKKFSLDEDVPDEDVPDEVDDMHGMLRSAFGIQDPEFSSQEPEERPNAEAEKFYKLVDANQELYPGCKNFTKLAFVVRLYHIKCLNGWSDKSFTMLLDLLKEAFPEGETLPKSFYETKKIIGELGLGYNKIDACLNDCMLYWKQTANESVCFVCGTSRWKTYDDGDVIYYDVLTDIIQLDYYKDRKVVLFKCDWVDITSHGRGIKLDELGFTLVNLKRLLSTNELGFTLVNLKRLLSTNEPFVLASQALQVSYVEDPIERNWHVAIKTKPRNFLDMHENVNVNEEESYLESRPYDAQQLEDICVDADNISEVRADVPGTTIDTLIGPQATREDQGDDSEFDDTEFVDSDIII
ncbi:hypothetical protein MRB53_001594 [Persea americana]|uniref:Uncharacterized protein n=1 Tax=Persea americana TaxID=3435 RepID=A0ACC2MS96_PERAE|nr:hypothetical protein MRB53_001594 [Persea americana]